MANNDVVYYDIQCGKTKRPFYLRYDFSADDQWVLTYGVKEKETGRSGNHGFTKIDISKAAKGPQYKCPYCGGTAYFQCGKCHKLTCYVSGIEEVTCSWCGNSGTLGGCIQEMEGVRGDGQ